MITLQSDGLYTKTYNVLIKYYVQLEVGPAAVTDIDLITPKAFLIMHSVMQIIVMAR